MGSGLKKKKANRMGDYLPSNVEREAMRWCIDNHIKISPKETRYNSGEWKAAIQIGHGKVHESPEAFGGGEIWEVIYNYYMYYYEQNRGRSSETTTTKS